MKKAKKDISETVILEKPELDTDTYNKRFEIREKRINTVFKVIYVFAIMFVTVFLDISNKFYSGMGTMYGIECCIASFLLVMLGSMVLYIINEMKCMKLNAADLSKEQIIDTEKSYSNIFVNLYICGLACLIFAAIHVWLPNDFVYPPQLLVIVSTVFLGVSFASFIASLNAKETWKSICQYCTCFSTTIVIIALLLIPAVQASITA